MRTKTVPGLDPMTEVVLGQVFFWRQQEIIDWCVENISPNYGWRFPDQARWGDDWGIASYFGHSHFYFLNEHDALMFLLRWSDGN